MKLVALLLICVCTSNTFAELTNSWPFPPLAHPSAKSRSLILSNRLDEALQDLTLRIDADNEDGALFANLAVVNLKKENDLLAIESCRKAVRFGQNDQLPLLVFLLIKNGHIEEARCLVPLLKEVSTSSSVELSTKIESLCILISYAIARNDESGALGVIDAMEAIPNWETAMTPASCSWLTSQAGAQELINARGRLIKISAILKGSTSEQPAYKKWTAGGGIYTGFTKAALAGLQDYACDQSLTLRLGNEMQDEMDLVAKGRIKEAIKKAEALVGRRPAYARGWRFLGSCYNAIGDSARSFQCTSNAVVLGDGYAVINLAIDADDRKDVNLWKSLSGHLEAIMGDWQFDYISGRMEAYVMRVKLADTIEDKPSLRRLFKLLPIATEADAFPAVKLRRVDEILRYLSDVASRHSVDIDSSLASRCRARAAIAASRSQVAR